MSLNPFSYFKSKPYRNFYSLSEVDKLAIHSVSYLEAADKLYEIKNRFSSWWVPAYYLLYHSLELAFKTCIGNSIQKIPSGHSISKIYNSYKNILNLSQEEINVLKQLENLNSGKGQLRYPNSPIGDFYPNVFIDCREIIIKILKRVEDDHKILTK